MLPFRWCHSLMTTRYRRIRYTRRSVNADRLLNGAILEPIWRLPQLFWREIGWFFLGPGLPRRIDGATPRCRHRRSHREKRRLGFEEDAIGPVLNDAQEQKWNRCGCNKQ